MALAGLVSYDSSGDSDSESSDNENNSSVITRNPEPSSSKLLTNGPGSNPPSSVKTLNENHLDNLIDDEAVDDIIVGPSVPSSLALPKPKYSENDSELSQSTELSSESDSVTSGLASLPKAVNLKETLENLDDEVEEEFRKLPKNAELPKPVKKKSLTGKVKISLPVLPTYDSDEEDGPETKRPRIQPPGNGGKSGLIGLLPQPKNFITKEVNRLLVPHALSKKTKPAAEKPVVKPAGKPRLVDAGSDDSDDEHTGANFFSISSKNEIRNPTLASVSLPSVEAKPHVQEPTEAPLSFKNSTNFNTSHQQVYLQPAVGPSRPQTQYEESASAQYAVNDYPLEEFSASAVDFETHQKLIQDEQFKRMVGKNFRDAEVLDIMDVRADDQMADQLDITKSLTEEKSNMSYSKKRKDLPSRLSRQKHQITYLAFQAKEQELELKNQWSQNKMTKRQTQAKYGF